MGLRFRWNFLFMNFGFTKFFFCCCFLCFVVGAGCCCVQPLAIFTLFFPLQTLLRARHHTALCAFIAKTRGCSNMMNKKKFWNINTIQVQHQWILRRKKILFFLMTFGDACFIFFKINLKKNLFFYLVAQQL